jgi:hypothetical protein
MNFTAGLLFVFLNVFLPGLIFLRFYFIGEFSKQFNTRIPIIRLAFYSLIPGVLFFLLSIYIYGIFDSKFLVSSALEIYLNLSSSNNGFSTDTSDFLDKGLGVYILFTTCTVIISGLFGFLIHYVIRKFNFDKKYKVFRFKNYWYYIFSGEIVKFPKFDRAIADIQIDGVDKDSDVIMAYADILVNECGKSRMYTGYVLDYELEQDNINSLDKIYLLDAHKFDYSQNQRLRFQSNHVKKSIPGQLFVIDYKTVLNINLTYIPSYDRMFRELDKLDRNHTKWEFLGTIIIILSIIFSISLVWFNWPYDFFSSWKLGHIMKIILYSIVVAPMNFILFSIYQYLLKQRKKVIEKVRSRLIKEYISNNEFASQTSRNNYILLQSKKLENLKKIKSSKIILKFILYGFLIQSVLFLLAQWLISLF